MTRNNTPLLTLPQSVPTTGVSLQEDTENVGGYWFASPLPHDGMRSNAEVEFTFHSKREQGAGYVKSITIDLSDVGSVNVQLMFLRGVREPEFVFPEVFHVFHSTVNPLQANFEQVKAMKHVVETEQAMAINAGYELQPGLAVFEPRNFEKLVQAAQMIVIQRCCSQM